MWVTWLTRTTKGYNKHMQSQLYRLTSNDLIKGVMTAIFAAVVVAVYGVVMTPGFDLFMTDWNGVLHLAINAAFGGLVGYLGKNFLSDEQGKVFGRIG